MDWTVFWVIMVIAVFVVIGIAVLRSQYQAWRSRRRWQREQQRRQQ